VARLKIQEIWGQTRNYQKKNRKKKYEIFVPVAL